MTKAETIRFLYRERCSPAEIAAVVGWHETDVIEWLHKPDVTKVGAWRTGEMQAGQTAYEVATATGRSQSAVRSAAKRMGVELLSAKN
ncbi:hypothetical protein [Stenotrophomonas phage SOVA965]